MAGGFITKSWVCQHLCRRDPFKDCAETGRDWQEGPCWLLCNFQWPLFCCRNLGNHISAVSRLAFPLLFSAYQLAGPSIFLFLLSLRSRWGDAARPCFTSRDVPTFSLSLPWLVGQSCPRGRMALPTQEAHRDPLPGQWAGSSVHSSPAGGLTAMGGLPPGRLRFSNTRGLPLGSTRPCTYHVAMVFMSLFTIQQHSSTISVYCSQSVHCFDKDVSRVPQGRGSYLIMPQCVSLQP